MDIETNPYRSPQTIESSSAPTPVTRPVALFQFRVAVALLIFAALVNAFFLPRYRYMVTHVELIKYRIGLFDFIFICAIGFLAMAFTIEALERIAKFLRRMFAPKSDPEAWNAAIYNAFRHAIPLGLAGVLLWIAWVVAFFELRVNFYVISYAVGIPAHLLAASIYLPLLYGWFKAARTTAVSP